MTPPRKLLTEKDLDRFVERIIESIKSHSCTRGLTDEDAVFVRKLRRSSDHTAAMLWKGFLGLVGIGFVLMFVVGIVAAGAQILRRMGVL